MKSICSYFDKVYCINLEERTDRWDSCLEKFKEYWITNFKRFEGIKVNGNLSSKKLGQIGCSASFYNILKDARDKNWGIEGDYEADDEDDAIALGQAQAIKYGAKRSMFYAFLANSKELEDFMDDHDFID